MDINVRYMNKLLLILMLVISCNGISQITDTVQVGFYKSVYLIFSDEPEVIDAGSEHLSVRTNGNKVILQILNADDWEQTSLFVENNGVAYVFIIDYNDNMKRFVYDYSRGKIKVSGESEIKQNGNYSSSNNTSNVVLMPSYTQYENDSIMKARQDSIYRSNSERLLSLSDRIGNRGIVKYRFGFYLRDIMINDNKVYLKFEVNNKSNIEFRRDLEMYKVINVKRRIKGSSEQIVPLTHLFEYNAKSTINGKENYYYVVVVDKFVLTKDKKLNIVLWEVNGSDMNEEGGRKLSFDVFYDDILKMIAL